MKNYVVFAMLLLTMACFVPQANAQCNGIPFTGTWGFSLTGSEIRGNGTGGPFGLLVNVAGVFTVLPTGGLQVTATTNGNIQQTGVVSQENINGRFTINTSGPNANFVGTLTLRSASAANGNYDFYCGLGGAELFLIKTDSNGLILSGVAHKVQ